MTIVLCICFSYDEPRSQSPIHRSLIKIYSWYICILMWQWHINVNSHLISEEWKWKSPARAVDGDGIGGNHFISSEDWKARAVDGGVGGRKTAPDDEIEFNRFKSCLACRELCGALCCALWRKNVLCAVSCELPCLSCGELLGAKLQPLWKLQRHWHIWRNSVHSICLFPDTFWKQISAAHRRAHWRGGKKYMRKF